MTGGHDHVVELHEIDVVADGPARPSRHPVEVTTDRLTDHVNLYGRHLTPTEVDTIADAIVALDALRARLDAHARRARGE